jgi:hypothetical protein
MVAGLVAVTGCSRAPVTITNQSPFILSNVVVSGSGFSEHIATIEAGEDCRLSVRPRGESGLRLVFEVGTQRVDSGEQGYFEGGGNYRVKATVDTNLSVSISSDSTRY